MSSAIPKLRAPLVLAHGLLSSDGLRVGELRVREYFVGIGHRLEVAGNRVLRARTSPTDGVRERAEQLRAFLDRVSPSEPVHIIAHSMGGLDARYFISKLGGAGRVLSLTTVGTPHRGSPFADWGVARFERTVRPIFQALGIPHRAFEDLTTTACRAFNEEVPDAPGVRYYSVAGRCNFRWLSLAWQFPYHIVRRHEGDNDGVVSVASARWGADCEIWDGDHFNLINWPNPHACLRGLWRDRTHDYARLLRRLADEGF